MQLLFTINDNQFLGFTSETFILNTVLRELYFFSTLVYYIEHLGLNKDINPLIRLNNFCKVVRRKPTNCRINDLCLSLVLLSIRSSHFSEIYTWIFIGVRDSWNSIDTYLPLSLIVKMRRDVVGIKLATAGRKDPNHKQHKFEKS